MFTTDFGFEEVYPMKTKADAYDCLNQFCTTYGILKHIVVDNAAEENWGNWNSIQKKFLLMQSTTEPGFPWQNRTEGEIKEHKRHTNRIMAIEKAPRWTWSFASKYTARLRRKLARDTADGRSPEERLTGETHDISEFLHFNFYGWCKFRDSPSFPGDEEIYGCWLGPADNVGQAMCYWILKENGKVVARSTVRPLTDEELHDENEKARCFEFDKNVQEIIGGYEDLSLLDDEDFRNDELELPIEDSEAVDDVKLRREVKDDLVSGPDPFIGAKVYMPHGDRTEIAKVLGRKRGPDGNYIGRAHANPILDSRQFIIEFPDGDQQDIAYNMLAEHLFSQVDEEGNQYQMFKAIIGHRRKKDAVDKADQYTIHKNGK
jgi:hypothetical protein